MARKLSPAQIYALAREAGLTRTRAIIATAIALAESNGGDPEAHNATPPDNSYGLWQINMIGSMGPDRRAKLGISNNEELFDPRVNARAMALVSNNGQNFGPWTTYGSGAYKEHMGAATRAAESNWQKIARGLKDPVGTITGAAGDTVAGALGEAVEPLTKGFRKIAIEGAFVTLGLALAGMGAWQAVGPSVKRARDRGLQAASMATGTGAATKAAGAVASRGAA